MTFAPSLLFTASAVSVSFILLKASGEKVERAKRESEFAAFLEERIRLTRTPIDEAAASFEGGAEILASFRNDEYTSRLIEAISLGTPEAAAANAALLKNHKEKEMMRIKDEETKRRTAKASLPTLFALLMIILFL